MTRRLRIAFVGPADSISLRRWVGWFAARGHGVTVLTVEPAENPAFRQIDLRVPGPRKAARLVSAFRLARRLRRLEPHVVHVHYARGLAWALAFAPIHPLVVTPWGSDILEDQGAFRDWGGRRLTPRVMRQADLVTVHSRYLEERARRLLPAGHRVIRVGWGVNLRQFRPGLDVAALRERWDIADDRRVVFSPRLAQPFYHHDRVIEALPAVREKIPNVLLVIPEYHADPRYLQRLRALVARRGLGAHVRFVGELPYADMPMWLNLADAVVMVPRSDGMPNTLLEAMACGAVPILNRLPQYGEMIRHGINGLLVDPDGDLAGPITTVLSDPVLRGDMAGRNRELITTFGDQDREMTAMELLYHKLATEDSE